MRELSMLQILFYLGSILNLIHYLKQFKWLLLFYFDSGLAQMYVSSAFYPKQIFWALSTK